MTETLIRLENSASAEWRNTMLSRLETQTYSELVGVEKPRKILIDALLDEDSHFIIALDGLGGIGKTALADQITRDLIQTTRFDEIGWITAKHPAASALQSDFGNRYGFSGSCGPFRIVDVSLLFGSGNRRNICCKKGGRTWNCFLICSPEKIKIKQKGGVFILDIASRMKTLIFYRPSKWEVTSLIGSVAITL